MVARFFERMSQTEWDRVHAAVGPLPHGRPRDLFYGSRAAWEARSKHLQPGFEPSSPDDFEAVARAVDEAEARALREAVNRGVFPFAWAHLNRLDAPAERSYLLWYLNVMSVWGGAALPSEKRQSATSAPPLTARMQTTSWRWTC